MPGDSIRLPKRRQRKSRAKLNVSNTSQPRRSRPFTSSILPEISDAPVDEQNLGSLEHDFGTEELGDIHESVQGLGASSQHHSGSRQSHARRRENEEDHYKQYREDCLSIMGKQSFRNLLSLKATTSRAAFQQFAQEQAAEACQCNRCGYRGVSCGLPVRSVPIKLIALHHTVELVIPIYQCTRCSEAGYEGSKLFHIHPMMVGAFGGSALQAQDLMAGASDRERTWYDVSLLEFLRILRKNNARMAIDSLAHSIVELQVQHGQSLTWETLRKQLGKTLEEYENIIFMANTQLIERLHPEWSLLDDCAACGGMPKQEVAASGEAAQVQVARFHGYCDGNFRLPHLSDQGTATLHEPPIQHRLLNDKDVSKFCAANQREQAPIEKNDCNDFNADKELNRTQRKFDLTGVFGVFCRHGMLICALNMVTGEKWAYATLMLFTLLSNNIVPNFWCEKECRYDINCRYKGHFLRWLQKSTLPQHIKDVAGTIQFPLPTWHHSMHNALCQATNSFRGILTLHHGPGGIFFYCRMQGAGRGAGEPPEAAWSHFGPYGYLLQYASRPARQAALERIARYWNFQKLLQLPSLLLRMYYRAGRSMLEAEKTREELLDHVRAQGMSDTEFSDALNAPNPSTAPVTSEDLPWQAQYVELLLDQAALAQQISMRVTPDMLRFSVAGTSCLNHVNKKFKVANMIRNLETDHTIGESWQPGQAVYEEGLATLKQHRITSIQKEISILVQHLLLLEETFQRQATVRGDTKRLQSVKDRQVRKIHAALTFWTHWKAVQPGQVPAGDPQSESVPTALLRSVCKGDYPWMADDHAAGLVEVMVPRVKTQSQIMSRSLEEIRLVQQELAAATASIINQRQRISEEQEILNGHRQRLEDKQQQAHQGSALESDPMMLCLAHHHLEQELDSVEGLSNRLIDRDLTLMKLCQDFREAQHIVCENQPLSQEEEQAVVDAEFHFAQQQFDVFSESESDILPGSTLRKANAACGDFIMANYGKDYPFYGETFEVKPCHRSVQYIFQRRWLNI